MTQINNKFKVKQGLEVTGDSNLLNNLTVAGDVNIPTLPQTDNSNKAATTSFVKQAVADLVNSAPGALDTLKELADAIGDDPNFAVTINNNLSLKAPLQSPELTGIPTAPTPDESDNSDQLATTAFVQANKESPVFTGIPTAPTATVDNSSNQIATTEFVLNQAANALPLMNNAAVVGSSKKYARQDHAHPSDTKKANISGDTFTGTVNFVDIKVTDNISMSGSKVFQNLTENLALKTINGKDIVFGSGTNEIARFKSTGNVLIGTDVDNGTDKLQVNGTVTATTFKGGAALTGTPTAPTATAGTNTDQIATTKYVESLGGLKANKSNPNFSGGISNSDYSLLPFVSGGTYSSNSNVTGAMKISLPVTYNNSLVQFTLRIVEAASNKSFDLIMSGNCAGSLWSSTSSYIVGDTASKTPNVRYGNDGSGCCVWIGDLTTTWVKPQISIVDVTVSLDGKSQSWISGWSIAPTTTFDTVKTGPIVPSKMSAIDSPAFSGTPTAPTPTAGDNSNRIATTAYVDAVDVLKAPLASPSFTGTPVAPTASKGANTKQLATTEFVTAAISDLIASSPAALDTLNELAAALGNDANFSTTVTNSLATKAPLASPALTGVPTGPTAAVDTNTTQLATTQFVINQGYAKTAGNYAPIASPAFTGTPTVPTAGTGTRNTQVASTDFVHTALNDVLVKSIGGNVTLTATEALKRVLIFTGTLTANTTVTLPSGNGSWTIINNTSGSYTLSFKLSTGTSILIGQSYADQLVSDGSTLYQAKTNFNAVYLSGTSTASAPANTDNSSRIATTSFVKSQNYLDQSSVIDGGSF